MDLRNNIAAPHKIRSPALAARKSTMNSAEPHRNSAGPTNGAPAPQETVAITKRMSSNLN